VAALHGVIPERGDRLLLALAALLAVMAFPPFHLLIPSFVALVPLAVWVADQNGERDASERVFRGGVWFGALYFGLLLYWMPLALVPFTWWAGPVYLSVVMVLALGAGSFTWSLHRLIRDGVPLWVALPLTWTALEWLRSHAPGGLAFPWLGLGTSLTGYPELVGAAELVGARGITLWLALLNGLVAEAVRAARLQPGVHPGGVPVGALEGAREGAPASLRWAAAFVLVLAVPAAWGYWRANTLIVRAVGEVAVVQPNIAAQFRLDGAKSNDSTEASLTRLLSEGDGLSPAGPDLVVWPEMTFFGPIETDRSLRERVLAVAERWAVPVVFGAIGQSVTDESDLIPLNSAFLTGRDGRLAGFRYDKHRLVPLVEAVPFRRGGWKEEGAGVDSYGRGVEWPLGTMENGARFGILICSESMYASHARRFRLAGADFFLNLTNDGWLGGERWYTRTAALWQHPAHLVMRAIEQRVGVARAANTGFSLFVDPLGRVYGRTELFEAVVSSETIYTTDVLTVYTRTGDVAGWAALLLTLGLLLIPLPWPRPA
jgi:apolipoprotein N-acyltransferase